MLEEAAQVWEAYQTALAQVHARQKVVDAASVALDGMQRESREGTRSILDVLDTEQDFLNAQQALIQAQYNSVVSRFGILRVMGYLTADHLNLAADAAPAGAPTEPVQQDGWWDKVKNIMP